MSTWLVDIIDTNTEIITIEIDASDESYARSFAEQLALSNSFPDNVYVVERIPGDNDGRVVGAIRKF